MVDDLKRWPAPLVAALVVQTIAGLIWAGGAAARIGALEAAVVEQRSVAERLARLEAQGETTRATLARIEAQLSDE